MPSKPAKKPIANIVINDRRERSWKFSDLVTDPITGRMREAFVWSNLGKALSAWLVITFSDMLINHWEILTILMTIIVAPKLFEVALQQVINWKFGAHQSPKQVTTGQTK